MITAKNTKKIMKNFRYALCALAAASATVACSGDDTFDTPKNPADEAKFTVVVDNNVTRTSFTDGVGMQGDLSLINNRRCRRSYAWR